MRRSEDVIMIFHLGSVRWTYLKQRMSSNDSQETFQSFSSGLYDFVGEAVGEDLAGELWDVDASCLTLEGVAKCLEVGVASSDYRVAKFECGNVGLRIQGTILINDIMIVQRWELTLHTIS